MAGRWIICFLMALQNSGCGVGPSACWACTRLRCWAGVGLAQHNLRVGIGQDATRLFEAVSHQGQSSRAGCAVAVH